jgi:hypothetical protein
MTKQDIIDLYPDEDILFADGFDDAIIGIDTVGFRVVYSYEMIIEILMSCEDMTYEDAIDHYSYNIEGAYVGPQTPIYCRTHGD